MQGKMAGLPVAAAVEPGNPVFHSRNLNMQSRAVACRPVPGHCRAGLTLVEILIAMTMTLIVLGVMIAVFSRSSQEMARGRALMEMHNDLRVCSDLLRDDLERVTVDLRPWALESAPNGYFEYVEGPRRDASEIGIDPTRINNLNNVRGDFDDILAMTVRSDGIPFRGRRIIPLGFPGAGSTETVESNIAEIIWFTNWDDRDNNSSVGVEERVTVYRRVLLIRPDLALASAPTPEQFFLMNDISASFYGVAAGDPPQQNSLEDLAKRENRFGHVVAPVTLLNPYLHQLDRTFLANTQLSTGNLATLASPLFLQVAGSDVVANDVVGFDVRVWSPDAQVRMSDPAGPTGFTDAVLIQPGDAAYAFFGNANVATVANAAGLGAFVDLGYGTDIGPAPYTGNANNALTCPQFATSPNPKSRLEYPFVPPPVPPPAVPLVDRVYDTFSTHYETNGLDDDDGGSGPVDEGTDGLDTNPPDPPGPPLPSGNGVDDVGEREVEPPYPFTVRGIKVTFRTVHRESAQMHQTAVVQSYVRQ